MIDTSSRDPNVRAHLFISGRVQGVFFRSTTRRRAASRGVAGFVRNLPDGRVEAVFEGPEEAVREMISWCRQGPRSARVESVQVNWEEPTGEFSVFSVRY